MKWLYTLSICASLAVFAGSLRADDPVQTPARVEADKHLEDKRKSLAGERDARLKDGRWTNGIPAREPRGTNGSSARMEAEKRREQLKNMTPEERAAKRKEIKGRLEKRIVELRSKQTNATLSAQETRELERREQILKRFEQETIASPRTERVKPVLTNAPVEK
jgi:hypothetical protein